MKNIIFISILTLLLSCNSNDDDGLFNSKLKLTKIKSSINNNPSETTVFEYDEQLRLIEQKDGSGNIIFTYNYENDKITSIVSNSATTNYNYSGNLITSASNSVNNTLVEYEYNALEQLVTSKSYLNGILQCEINYTYNNQDNIETVSNSCSSTGAESNRFEYDNMKNQNSLLFNSGLLKVFSMGNNNTTHAYDSNSNVLYTIVYEYNNQGYPIISTTSNTSTVFGTSTTSTFRREYTYENITGN